MVADTGNLAASISEQAVAADRPFAKGARTDWYQLRREIVRRWYCLRQFALVLWVVRVPLSTTALGLLILIFASQAQDLFVEFARTSFWWMLYFLLVLIALWAMPTHYAARLLVDTDARLQRRLSKETELKQKRAQGQPLEEWELGFATCVEASCVFVPRALGVLTFVAVLAAIWRSDLNLPDLHQHEVIVAIDRALIKIAILVIVGLIGFLVYVSQRRGLAHLPPLRELKHANRVLAPLWRAVSPGVPDAPGSDDEANRDLGRTILFGIFVIFAIIFAWGADFAAMVFPRAMAVPFILGGWLPLLSYLSGLGRHWRAPLVAGIYGVVSVLAVVLGDDHSVRRIDAEAQAGAAVDTEPIPLQTAVTMWMHENGCEEPQETCPRPIIIAAEGGASRAGFFTATILGYFLDGAADHGLNPNQLRERLFAISSASGGSMGAIMVTAALAAKNNSNGHPCIQRPVDLWWGKTVGNWRDCFEALTSGDFLTADFFGFAFNDMWPFAFRDRAAVLEDSWSRRYREVITRADPPEVPTKCQALDCPFLALRPRDRHWIPLLVLNGTSEATGGRIVTTALDTTYVPDKQSACPENHDATDCPLFLHADRFHDLLNSQVTSSWWFGWLGWYERFLLRNSAGNDVRLSTAAHNSARFPLISPPGAVRNRDQSIVDRIVDGGYFDNYGALSAEELALALHAVRPQLRPLVVVISNDPDDPLDASDDSIPKAVKPQIGAVRTAQLQGARAEINTTEWFPDFTAPVTTIVNARTAHGTLNVDELHNALHDVMPNCAIVLVQIRVWPQLRENSDHSRAVSMSWWLSSPIQRHLHQQTEDQLEDNHNQSHLKAIWGELKSSTCTLPKDN